MFHITERPAALDEVVGHESVISSIKSVLASDDPPHVYMLTGPSGVGKTTIARIVAHELGGRGMGIIEKNVSNETGVDYAREIAEEANYTPMVGAVRVYILDEVDKASEAWQSSMKKPLEDVPGHTYYFLCTENPGKVKKALHTRSTEYELRPLSDEDMLYLLKRVVRGRELDVELDILKLICENAEGSPRRGLTMLEKVSECETKEEARELVEIGAESPEVRELCQALLKGESWKKVAGILKTVKEEPEAVRRVVLGYMNAVLLNSGKRKAFEIIEVFEDPLYSSGKAGLTRMCYEAVED